MKYNFLTEHPCVRINNIKDNELHDCYFCGYEISVKTPICDVCGLMPCPSCGKCFCKITEEEQKLLVKLHEHYCMNPENLSKAGKNILDDFGDHPIVKNFNKVIVKCGRWWNAERTDKDNANEK